ncbi:MAG: hypothetical protein QXZ57_03595, partial [Nitrososphaerota archaeon]
SVFGEASPQYQYLNIINPYPHWFKLSKPFEGFLKKLAEILRVIFAIFIIILVFSFVYIFGKNDLKQ